MNSREAPDNQRPTTVRTYEEVRRVARNFSLALTSDQGLARRLRQFRSWYLVPEEDAIAPSKYFYVVDGSPLTGPQYRGLVDDPSAGLDGRDTELVLSRWFDEVSERTPEGQYVMKLTRILLNEYGKEMRVGARFNVPKGWKSGQGQPLVPSIEKAVPKFEQSASGINPIVEVFWRAYLGLYPEDQRVLADRILKHIGG